MESIFSPINNAGGKWDKIKPFPQNIVPYTKGKKLEMNGAGNYTGTLTLDMDVELIGIGIVSSDEAFTEDYVEIEIEELKVVETCYLQNMRSNIVSEINFKKAYPLPAKKQIRYNYYFLDEQRDYKVLFLNFHFLIPGERSRVPSEIIMGDTIPDYHRIPTVEDTARPKESYNLIGTDEDGGQSVLQNHKRFNNMKNINIETINGQKMINTKTPNGSGEIPLIEKPLKVLEVIPYNVSAHPQGLSVLSYIDSLYGSIAGQKTLDITGKTYFEAESLDLSQFEAIFFSPADCNAYAKLSDIFKIKLEEYIKSGRVVVACHDSFLSYNTNFGSLASYWNIRLDNNAVTYWSGNTVEVNVANRSQITDYPFKLPETFTVLGYHRTGLTVKLGDNWIIDSNAVNNQADFTKNYVWCTSQDNCVFLEAGHLYYSCSNGGIFNRNPLEWEGKAIINSLYSKQEERYQKLESVSEYVVNLPSENTKGGYVEFDLTCYTKKVVDGVTSLKAGACTVEIYNDNKLLETIKFPQNDLDQRFYNEGWSTIQYKGKLGVFANSKTIKIKYTHTSTNASAFLNIGECNFKAYV